MVTMMRACMVLSLLLLFSSSPYTQEQQSSANDPNEMKRLHDATVILGEIMAADDQAVPESILAKAEVTFLLPHSCRSRPGTTSSGLRDS